MSPISGLANTRYHQQKLSALITQTGLLTTSPVFHRSHHVSMGGHISTDSTVGQTHCTQPMREHHHWEHGEVWSERGSTGFSTNSFISCINSFSIHYRLLTSEEGCTMQGRDKWPCVQRYTISLINQAYCRENISDTLI